MSTMTIGAMVFAAIFACALLGLLIRGVLPEPHLTADSRDVMKLALGLVATMAALVLGLLTASAKREYDTENDAVMASAAEVILLDRTLARYGAEAQDLRADLRQVVAGRIALTWPEVGRGTLDGGGGTARTAEHIEDGIRALVPTTDAQRELRTKALGLADQLLAMRWMVFTRAHNTIPTVFLVVLVSWVGLLFAGFGLLAPRNLTVVVIFASCAVAVSGSIFLILEMSEPFTGAIKVSGAPLQYALDHIGR